MHEIGIVRSMCKTVVDYAHEHNVKNVAEIVCEVGELSLVIPEYVEELFPPVKADIPELKDTKLILEIIPGLAECDDCDEIFNVVQHEGYCPNCGSFNKTVLSGRDFNVKEIHVTD
jgi:hydrogenase nickel incorporation protein HypA/HybF